MKDRLIQHQIKVGLLLTRFKVCITITSKYVAYSQIEEVEAHFHISLSTGSHFCNVPKDVARLSQEQHLRY